MLSQIKYNESYYYLLLNTKEWIRELNPNPIFFVYISYLHVIDFLLLVKFSMIVYTLLSILEIELYIFNTIYPLSIRNLFWIFSLRIKSKISMIHKYPFLCFEKSLNSLNNVSHKYLPLS